MQYNGQKKKRNNVHETSNKQYDTVKEEKMQQTNQNERTILKKTSKQTRTKQNKNKNKKPTKINKTKDSQMMLLMIGGMGVAIVQHSLSRGILSTSGRGGECRGIPMQP